MEDKGYCVKQLYTMGITMIDVETFAVKRLRTAARLFVCDKVLWQTFIRIEVVFTIRSTLTSILYTSVQSGPCLAMVSCAYINAERGLVNPSYSLRFSTSNHYFLSCFYSSVQAPTHTMSFLVSWIETGMGTYLAYRFVCLRR